MDVQAEIQRAMERMPPAQPGRVDAQVFIRDVLARQAAQARTVKAQLGETDETVQIQPGVRSADSFQCPAAIRRGRGWADGSAEESLPRPLPQRHARNGIEQTEQ